MEKVLNEILLKLSNLEDGQKKSEAIQSEFNLEQKRLISKVDNIESDVGTLKSDVHEIRDIVTRIEVSQNEDVIALLKTFNNKIDSKSEVLNKRLFRVESKLEAST